MKHDVSIGEKYGPAMTITDEAEAARYFEECVAHCMSHGQSREEAERIERANLGYYADYYSDATRERVELLFACTHPVFGSIAAAGAPSPEQAFGAGLRMGRLTLAIAACRAVVDANDSGMTAEEGRRAVELCRAAIADADAKGAR